MEVEQVSFSNFNHNSSLNNTLYLNVNHWSMRASALTLAPLALGAIYSAICANVMSAFVRRKATWRLTVLDNLSVLGFKVVLTRVLLVHSIWCSRVLFGPLPLFFAYLKVVGERTTMIFLMTFFVLMGVLRYSYVFHWKHMQEFEDALLLTFCRTFLASASVSLFLAEHAVYTSLAGDFFLGIGAEIALLCEQEGEDAQRWTGDSSLRAKMTFCAFLLVMTVCGFLYGRIYLREYLASRAIRKAYLANNNLVITVVNDKNKTPDRVMDRGCSCTHFENSSQVINQDNTSRSSSLDKSPSHFIFSREGTFLVGLTIVALFIVNIGTRLLTVNLSKHDLEVITQTIMSPLNISVALPTIMLLQSKHLRRFLRREVTAHARRSISWLGHPRGRIMPSLYFCFGKKFGDSGGNRVLPS